MKRLMVGSIDNRIWYGEVKDRGSFYTMPGKREDVTDDAIRTVFEWMLQNLKDTATAFQIRYPTINAVMEIRRESNKEDDDDEV